MKILPCLSSNLNFVTVKFQALVLLTSDSDLINFNRKAYSEKEFNNKRNRAVKDNFIVSEWKLLYI